MLLGQQGNTFKLLRTHQTHPRLRLRPSPDKLGPRPAGSSPNRRPAPDPSLPGGRGSSHLGDTCERSVNFHLDKVAGTQF